MRAQRNVRPGKRAHERRRLAPFASFVHRKRCMEEVDCTQEDIETGVKGASAHSDFFCGLWHDNGICRWGGVQHRRSGTEKEKDMKRTVSLLTAALFAGALAGPALAQSPATESSPAAAAPSAESSSSTTHHHAVHHHHARRHHHTMKKKTMASPATAESPAAETSPAAP